MMDKKGREKVVVRASLVGILMNAGLVAGKAIVGFLAGSISILLDAVNNLSDILSSLVTLCGIKIAGRRPDKEHPYGHGRVEYLAAIGVGLVILFAGVGALIESIPKILKPSLAEYSLLTVIIVSLAVIVKLFFAGFVRRKGELVNSGSLIATGVDAFYDALLSLGTLVGVLVSMFFGISVDGIIGAVISIFIIRASLKILGEGWTEMIGRKVDAKLLAKLRKMILKEEDVKRILEFKLHSYGPMKVIGAVRIEVSEKLSLKELKKITDRISEKAFDEFGVELIVGI